MSGRAWSWVSAGLLTLLGLILAMAQGGLGSLTWAPLLLGAGALAGIAGAWGALHEFARRTAQQVLKHEQASLERLKAADSDARKQAWNEITEARKAVQNAAQAVSEERAQARATLAQAETIRDKAERRIASEKRRRENAVAAAARLRRKTKTQGS